MSIWSTCFFLIKNHNRESKKMKEQENTVQIKEQDKSIETNLKWFGDMWFIPQGIQYHDHTDAHWGQENNARTNWELQQSDRKYLKNTKQKS